MKMMHRSCGSITPLICLVNSVHVCWTNSKLEVIQVLLDNGAYVNGRDCCGRTPLILAAMKKTSEIAIQILLDHGADFTVRDDDGKTALVHATEQCQENVPSLLQCTTNMNEYLNLQASDGRTALMWAVIKSNVSLTQKLIDLGADVNIKDKDGNTALLLAATFCCDAQQILRLLIRAGSDVNCQNNNGFSPLMLVAQHSVYYAMLLLLDSGADVNAVSHKDHTTTALSVISNSSAYETNKQKVLFGVAVR